MQFPKERRDQKLQKKSRSKGPRKETGDIAVFKDEQRNATRKLE
jgi:hypothetical protein